MAIDSGESEEDALGEGALEEGEGRSISPHTLLQTPVAVHRAAEHALSHQFLATISAPSQLSRAFLLEADLLRQ